jgi:hypothetical protein
LYYLIFNHIKNNMKNNNKYLTITTLTSFRLLSELIPNKTLDKSTSGTAILLNIERLFYSLNFEHLFSRINIKPNRIKN